MDEHLRNILRQTRSDPSEENISLLEAHYRRAGQHLCACESVRCRHNDLAPVCIEAANPDIMIQHIFYACDRCAASTPMEYHGYVNWSDTSWLILPDDGPDTHKWYQCRCGRCQVFDRRARFQANQILSISGVIYIDSPDFLGETHLPGFVQTHFVDKQYPNQVRVVYKRASQLPGAYNYGFVPVPWSLLED